MTSQETLRLDSDRLSRKTRSYFDPPNRTGQAVAIESDQEQPAGAAEAGADRLDRLYAARPPWDIGRPQPALAALAASGALRGRLLDVGCGTGEHTLMAAASGLDATGVDLSAAALRIAEEKARARSLTARFLRHDALRLPELGERFDTALDALLLHALSAADRAGYLAGLREVLRPGGRVFVLCYRDRQPDGVVVPHALSRRDIESCFTGGWRLDRLEPVRSEATIHPGGVAAWLATATRS